MFSGSGILRTEDFDKWEEPDHQYRNCYSTVDKRMICGTAFGLVKSLVNIDSLHFEFAFKIHHRGWSTMIGVVEADHPVSLFNSVKFFNSKITKHRQNDHIGFGGVGWGWYCENNMGYVYGSKYESIGFYGEKEEKYQYLKGDIAWIRVDRMSRNIYYKKNNGEYKELFIGCDFPKILRIAVTVEKDEKLELVHFRDLMRSSKREEEEIDRKERLEFMVTKMCKNFEVHLKNLKIDEILKLLMYGN